MYFTFCMFTAIRVFSDTTSCRCISWMTTRNILTTDDCNYKTGFGANAEKIGFYFLSLVIRFRLFYLLWWGNRNPYTIFPGCPCLFTSSFVFLFRWYSLMKRWCVVPKPVSTTSDMWSSFTRYWNPSCDINADRLEPHHMPERGNTQLQNACIYF